MFSTSMPYSCCILRRISLKARHKYGMASRTPRRTGNNLLEILDVTDWPKGIKLSGVTIEQFWDNLVSAFGVPANQITDYIANGKAAKRFNWGGINVSFYWASSGYWTITINGNEFKFRF